jgi:predicted ArsR family transcriptional regulator
MATQKTPRQAEALALHRQGLPPAQIAQALGVSYQRARQLLRLAGVRRPVRERSEPGAGRPPSRPLDEHQAALAAQVQARRKKIAAALKREPGLTSARLAEALGVGVSQIQKDRQALGLVAARGRPRKVVVRVRKTPITPPAPAQAKRSKPKPKPKKKPRKR